MKIRRITIEVELPWEGTEPLADDLLKVVNDCLRFWTYQSQAWSELSPNTRIRDMTRNYEDAKCEKCNRPMNEHDIWNRCPVNCETCGLALKLHGTPGSGCPGRMANHLVQAAQAERWLTTEHARLKAEGYMEDGAGALVSPDGKTRVEW
jgi:hypothetical protein